jgi:hypothetical protein
MPLLRWCAPEGVVLPPTELVLAEMATELAGARLGV